MNNTNAMNGTAPSAAVSPDLSLEFRVVKISIYVIIFVLTIIGNGLVISVIRNDKRMRSSSHVLVFNLAVCDLITPTISLPFDLAYEEMHYAWPFGSTMCKMLWPSQTLSTTCSVLILTAICVDRYRALVYPFKVRWAGKFCLMICAIYVLSISVVIPYILVLRMVKNAENRSDCVETWPEPQKKFRQAYTIVLFLIQYALPLLLMISLYSITLRSLYNNTKSFPGMASGSMRENGSIKSAGTTEEQRRMNSLQEQRKEQHLKVTKMFITVVIVFAISMFPNQVFWLWVDFGNLSVNQYFSMTSIICRIFTYSNSVLNPFIYGLYSKDFRKGYRKAGRRISEVHRQPAFYLPQKKRNFESGICFGTTFDKTKLISVNFPSLNEIAHQPMGSKRTAPQTDVKTNCESLSPKKRTDVKSTNGQNQRGSNAISDTGDHIDVNSNQRTAIELQEKLDAPNEINKDIYNSINSTGCNGDCLDEQVVEYFDELKETQC